MGAVLGACAGLFGINEDDVQIGEEVNERLAVEELLQDAKGEGYPVEITVECVDLPDKDKFSKSDPFVLCHTENGDGLQLLGRTETVQNNLNPNFITAIMDNYSTSEDHVLFFTVYHESDPGVKDENQQLLGKMSIELTKLIEASPQPVSTPLSHPKESSRKSGFLLLTAMRVSNVQEEIEMEISAEDLPRYGRTNPHPFVTVSRVQRNRMIPVAKTNVCRSTTSPVWNHLQVKSYRLSCNNDDMTLQFQVHSYDPSGKHRYIGSMKTKVCTLLSGVFKGYILLNENKVGKPNYNNSGVIRITNCRRTAPYGFLDYVKRGFEINCTLAIDMSLSNNKRSEPLHVVDPVDPKKRPNDYMKAIRAVCKVVGRYDKDQMFPVYGFGAALSKSDGKINHCFPLSLDKDTVEIQGADNIIKTYLDALQVIQMKEPTHMGPVIREVMQEQCDDDESSAGPAASYQLLVIITDGQIEDMTETIDALVDASSLPMSILIVGIGNVEAMGIETFDKMNQLDESKLRSVITGKMLERDVVNFIAFDSYKNLSANDFARGALAEVPRHFLSWVKMSDFNIETMAHGEREVSNPGDTTAAKELTPPVEEVDLFKEVSRNDLFAQEAIDPDTTMTFSDNDVTSENGPLLAAMGSAAFEKGKEPSPSLIPLSKQTLDNTSFPEKNDRINLNSGKGDANRLLEELLHAAGDYTTFDNINSGKNRRSLPPTTSYASRPPTGTVNPYGPAIATAINTRPVSKSHTPPVRQISGSGRGHPLSQSYHLPGTPLEI